MENTAGTQQQHRLLRFATALTDALDTTPATATSGFPAGTCGSPGGREETMAETHL